MFASVPKNEGCARGPIRQQLVYYVFNQLTYLAYWKTIPTNNRHVTRTFAFQGKTPSKPSSSSSGKKTPSRGKPRPVISDDEDEEDDEVCNVLI